MGLDLHITRAELWIDSENTPITAEEWHTYVAGDPELQPWPEQGLHFVRWLGQSKHADPWLDWTKGRIFTKWPDTALYRKMLMIAKAFEAHVLDDDHNVYVKETDWIFDPTAVQSVHQETRKPWWRRLFGR